RGSCARRFVPNHSQPVSGSGPAGPRGRSRTVSTAIPRASRTRSRRHLGRLSQGSTGALSVLHDVRMAIAKKATAKKSTAKKAAKKTGTKKTATKKTATQKSATTKTGPGFSAEEKAAMKQRAAELKAEKAGHLGLADVEKAV